MFKSNIATQKNLSEKTQRDEVCIFSVNRALSSEISFITVIKQLEKDKVNLTAKLNESNNQATRVTELKKLTEEEVNCLKIIVQAAEMNKQLL